MDENRSIDPRLAETLESIWDSLTDKQREKARACKTMNELAELAGREVMELPDEALDMVAGGAGGCGDGSDTDDGVGETDENPGGGDETDVSGMKLPPL